MLTNITLKTIGTWKCKDLRRWLKADTVMEGLYYDFKLCLPSVGQDREKRKLRHLFCAFANTKGGFIFFGVDNAKNAVGLPNNPEFNTNLARIVGVDIYPIIRTWDLAAKVHASRTTYVYIVYVPESPYFEKPHITDERIFVRRNGENRAINSGQELRRLLELEKFSPSCIESLEHELQKIKNCAFIPQRPDFMFLIQMRHYLEERVKLDSTFEILVAGVNELCRLYQEIERLSIGGAEGSSVTASQSLTAKSAELNEAVNSFIVEYRRRHLP